MRKIQFKEYICGTECEELLSFIDSPRKKLVFGTGNQARIIKDTLLFFNIVPEAYLTNNELVFSDTLMRDSIAIHPYDVKELDRDKYDVLIGVGNKYKDEIVSQLRELNYNHIFSVNDWEILNSSFRRLYFEYMMSGKDTLKDVLDINGIKIKNWKQNSKEYEESFLVEAVDVLYPKAFNDFTACVEGPYEYDKVKIPKDGIVIDAGANIGMFSVLAAKQCAKVYAFEPSLDTCKMLQTNSDLYDNISIIQKGLAEKTGVENFCVSVDGHGATNCFGNNVREGQNLEIIGITSIDDFVEEMNLPSVDYIKADIEGAERRMLRGGERH